MVTVEQTSNTCLALNNVAETVKHLVDQRLQGGNFAELSQVSRDLVAGAMKFFEWGIRREILR